MVRNGASAVSSLINLVQNAAEPWRFRRAGLQIEDRGANFLDDVVQLVDVVGEPGRLLGDFSRRWVLCMPSPIANNR